VPGRRGYDDVKLRSIEKDVVLRLPLRATAGKLAASSEDRLLHPSVFPAVSDSYVRASPVLCVVAGYPASPG